MTDLKKNGFRTRRHRKNSLISMLFLFFLLLILQVQTVFSQNGQQNNGNDSTALATTPAMVLQAGISFGYSFNKKLRMFQSFRTYNYLSDNTRNFEEISFGTAYYMGKINKFYFTSTLGYLINFDNLYKIHEFRPKYYLTTSYTINKIRLELRNRIEYRIILGDNSGKSIRYRPRFKVGTNFKINKFKFYPYIYDELFIGENGFNQHRAKLALAVNYNNFRIEVGNLIKIKKTKGITENWSSLNLSYTIPTFKRKITDQKISE